MSKPKKLIHGERNKELCEHLLVGKVYYDWVVTTAFYSSIHLLENKLLPVNIAGSVCNNISEVKKAYNLRGRHTARETLVQRESNDITIAIKYKWLDDRSRFSRYTTYKVTAAEASKASQYLNEIHKFCTEN